MTIQDKYKQVMAKHKIVMSELETKTDMHRKGIYNFLNGKQNTGYKTINRIAAPLGYELKLVKKSDDEK